MRAPGQDELVGKQSDRKRRDLFQSTLQRFTIAATAMALIFTGMAIYNEFGVIMARTRPAVTGTIAELVRSPGRHPITNAWIDFASGDGAQTRCRVKSWFRPTDKDIYVGAPIKVTPALTLCGAPWFPDHLHLPDEPLEVAAVGAALAGILLLCKRRHARHS